LVEFYVARLLDYHCVPVCIPPSRRIQVYRIWMILMPVVVVMVVRWR
jgi:hypothetical protein